MIRTQGRAQIGEARTTAFVQPHQSEGHGGVDDSGRRVSIQSESVCEICWGMRPFAERVSQPR